MNYTEQEKLAKSKQVAIQYILDIQLYADFKIFLNNKPKAELKPKLKQAFKDMKTENDLSIAKHQEQKLKNEAMDSEIDNF